VLFFQPNFLGGVNHGGSAISLTSAVESDTISNLSMRFMEDQPWNNSLNVVDEVRPRRATTVMFNLDEKIDVINQTSAVKPQSVGLTNTVKQFVSRAFTRLVSSNKPSNDEMLENKPTRKRMWGRKIILDQSRASKILEAKKAAEIVDRKARKVFPVAYALFNVTFWSWIICSER
jgi:hypothetical protein